MTKLESEALASEEQRHARAQALVATSGAPELLSLLGDPSWRVRKAALAAFEHLKQRSDLVPPLIAGLADPDNAGLRSACAAALSSMGEVAAPALIEALAADDVDQRKFIVEVLGGIDAAAVRQRLVAALDDPDDNVRSSVVDALGRTGGSEAALALRARLRDGNDLQLAAYALDALAHLSARVPLAEILPWLERGGVERLVYPLLGLSGEPAAAGPLVLAVATGSRGARAVAIKALGGLYARLDDASRVALGRTLASTEGVAERLLAALDDGEDALSEAAVVLVGALGDARLLPAVLASAASRPFVHAAIAVVRAGGAAVVPHLLAALGATEGEARVLFLEVIESLGSGDAVSALLAVAAGDEPRAAEAAVSALGKLGGPECIPRLMELARTADPEVARQTALALAAIGLRHLEPVAGAVRAAVESGDVRPAWLMVLGLLGREDDVRVLVTASHHRDAEVRRAALEAFRAFGDRIDEGAVVLALTDENPRVRAAAARALGGYSSEPAVDALLAATADLDPVVVAEALKALGAGKSKKAIATLITAAASTSAAVAIAALQSLYRVRPTELAQAIAPALGHADPEVVREAIVTSVRLPQGEASPILIRCLAHRSRTVRLAAAEMLDSRRLALPEEIVLSRLDEEREPLVREALERLLPARGKRR